MRSILLAIILCSCTVSFAGDTLPDSYKNGIGWDNGLSYRHLVGNNTWLGLAVGGSITSTRSNANDSQINKDTVNDSITYSSINPSTTDQRNYTIKISGIVLGKIAGYGVFGLNYFVQPSYSYTWTKDSIYGQNAQYPSTNDTHSQTVGIAAGIAPTVTLCKRFSLETKFGLSYGYTWSTNLYDYLSSPGENPAYKDVQESNSYAHSVTILGSPFSLSMSLSGHFYF
jgi:hypothetical protein